MLRGLLSLVLALSVTACVPLPIVSQGYETGSRGNVPAAPPEWIVAGTTSREDVLLRLGTPDEQARDGRWIGYLSSHHEGGIALISVPIAVAVTSVTYTERRLVIWLDEQGIVTRTEFTQKECPRTRAIVGGDSPEPERCLGFADLEGFRGIRSGPVGPDVDTAIGSFADVVWSTPFFDGKSGSAPSGLTAYRGPVVVTATAIVASGKKLFSETMGHVRLEFSGVTDISRFHRSIWNYPSLVVTMASGVEYEFFSARPGWLGRNDPETTERLIALVERVSQRQARAR